MAKKKRSLVVEGAGAAVPVIASLAGMPGVGGALKLASALSSLVDERRKRRLEKFAQEFLESGTPNVSAAAELGAALERPELNAKDAILDAVRALDDLVCDEVILSVTRFGGQVDYAACLCASAVRSYSAGLT